MKFLSWMSNNWVKLLLSIATLIYLPFAYKLISDSAACAPPIAPDHEFWEFYYRHLACRPGNELGDTLAGFFAPLAFIWLAGAVYIQSQELSAQRQELNETQQLMEKQLDVAREQVEETKASTALFQKQTNILEFEHQKRMQDAANKEFDEDLKLFLVQVGGVSTALRLTLYNWSFGINLSPETEQQYSIENVALFPSTANFLDIEQTISVMLIRINQFRNNIGLRHNGPGIEYQANSRESFHNLLSAFARLDERVPNLSPDYQIRAEYYRIGVARKELEEFIAKIDYEYLRFGF